MLTYGVDAMRARFEFLHGLGLSRKEAAGVLARCPTVLSLSVQANLWPKVEYLTQELSGTARSLTTWPVYLTLSLQHRCVCLTRWPTRCGILKPCACCAVVWPFHGVTQCGVLEPNQLLRFLSCLLW